MPIRYKCQECGSVLKIKDELAGTDGRCPKCKREFVVPAADVGGESAAQPAAADDADFDPVAFLLDDGGAEPASRSAPAAAPEKKTRQPVPRETAASGEAAAADAPPQRPKRSRAPAGESAAESAGAMLGGTASSNAKQLLTRSMEESRVRAAEMPEEPEEEKVDYSEFIKLLTTRILPGGAVVILLCVGLYMISSSWFSTDLPELGRVSGVVTRSGAPLPNAQITFMPLDIRASSATAITDEAGEYTLYYQEGVPGAVVGKNRVFVEALDERGHDLIEPQTPYGIGSNEVWVVRPGSQEIDIDTDKPAPPPDQQTDD
jgi:hypothetical protein